GERAARRRLVLRYRDCPHPRRQRRRAAARAGRRAACTTRAGEGGAVSWPLISFLLVGLVLAIGWLAYERARPSARMVAVVATLTAVAALGRDAFVALPDVKPITAMTLAVGYALGPLPGFTVGALGMFASNLLLGQGPYTPWQMAAWGLVGLAGAALGRLSGRRLGRVGLALACALAALTAKEVMNLYTWTIGASHTPGAFLLIAGTALPFDLTDAVASLLFGLAFAPELARLLARMHARMHVDWELGEPAPPNGRPPAPPGGRPLPAGAGSTSAMLGVALVAAPAGGHPPRDSARRARQLAGCCEPSIGRCRFWFRSRCRRRCSGGLAGACGSRWRAFIPAVGPKRGRRFRRRARSGLQRAVYGLGGDGCGRHR